MFRDRPGVVTYEGDTTTAGVPTFCDVPTSLTYAEGV